MAFANGPRMLSRTTWSILRNTRSLRTFITPPSSRLCPARLASSHSNHGNHDSKLTVAENNSEYAKEVERFKDTSNPDENWVFHGYNPYDREEDTFWHHHTMFFLVTVGLVGITFILAYLPDFRLTHWKQREAYLELARREKLGLPLIDPNLVDPAKMKQYLPSDEELGDTEVII